MANARRSVINNGENFSSRIHGHGRPIPKRGQVKVAILVGLAQTVASIFSHGGRRVAGHLS